MRMAYSQLPNEKMNYDMTALQAVKSDALSHASPETDPV